MTPTLIITADDFGYHLSYDVGILEAVRVGAVDAVSVMVGRVDELPAELVESGVALGAHLESGRGGGRGRGEVEQQMERFRQLVGREADYLDGHHHCHAAGGIVEAVAEIAGGADLPVRSIDADHRRLLRATGVRTPDRLIGRYSEAEPVLPPELESLPDGWTEWMVHPGRADPGPGSSYDAGREEDLLRLMELRLPPGVTRGDQRSLPTFDERREKLG